MPAARTGRPRTQCGQDVRAPRGRCPRSERPMFALREADVRAPKGRRQKASPRSLFHDARILLSAGATSAVNYPVMRTKGYRSIEVPSGMDRRSFVRSALACSVATGGVILGVPPVFGQESARPKEPETNIADFLKVPKTEHSLPGPFRGQGCSDCESEVPGRQ